MFSNVIVKSVSSCGVYCVPCAVVGDKNISVVKMHVATIKIPNIKFNKNPKDRWTKNHEPDISLTVHYELIIY